MTEEDITNNLQAPMHFEGGVPCPNCHLVLELRPQNSYAYFLGTPLVCQACSHKFDYWELVISEVTRPDPWSALGVLGAHFTAFQVVLKPQELLRIDLREHGVAQDARLLHLSLIGIGTGAIPIEWRPREILYAAPSPYVQVYGAPPFEKGEEPGPARLNCSVHWLPVSAYDTSWLNLAAGFESYSSRRFIDSIVPANVAVESRLTKLANEILVLTSSKERVRHFLDEAATYGYQLNVLIPALVSARGIPVMPNQLRGLLNRLRDYRNDLAHKGVLDSPLDQRATGEILAAALVGCHYTNFVRWRLQGSKDSK
jgi:hypothetical protein